MGKWKEKLGDQQNKNNNNKVFYFFFLIKLLVFQEDASDDDDIDLGKYPDYFESESDGEKFEEKGLFF